MHFTLIYIIPNLYMKNWFDKDSLNKLLLIQWYTTKQIDNILFDEVLPNEL